MEIKATTPCYKFRDVKPEEQIAKLKEELAEVEEACAKFKKTPTKNNLLDLLVEIIDVEACAKTFIYQLTQQYDKGELYASLLITDASNKVIAKNMYRGYYQTPEEAEEIAEKLNTNAAEPFKE